MIITIKENELTISETFTEKSVKVKVAGVFQ